MTARPRPPARIAAVVATAAVLSLVLAAPGAALAGTPAAGPPTRPAAAAAPASATGQAAAILVRPADLGSAWLVVESPGQVPWSPVRGTAPSGATCSGVATTFEVLPWTRNEPWPGYAGTELRKGSAHLFQLARRYRNQALAQRDYQRFLDGAQPCSSFDYPTEIGELPATMTTPIVRAVDSGLTYRFRVTDNDGESWGVAVGTSGRYVVVTSTAAALSTADRATRAALRRA
jgi:hypothetical protein